MTMAYFRFSRRATRETQRTYAAIASLNRGFTGQEDLIVEVRKISEEMKSSSAGAEQAKRRQLQRQSQELRAQISEAPSLEEAGLRSQPEKTEARLRQAESEASAAQRIIRSYAPSVCLIHLEVAFHEQASERHLHYVTAEGESVLEGNPILSLEGTGPEFLVHALGTGVSCDHRRRCPHQPPRCRAVVEQRRLKFLDSPGPRASDFPDGSLLPRIAAPLPG